MRPESSLPSHEPSDYECPFCTIVAGGGEPPFPVHDDVVMQSAATTAWISSRSWDRNAGHVIVVPNEHIENMYTVEPGLAGAIHETARRVALARPHEPPEERLPYGGLVCDALTTAPT